jgi:hypothetical protein
MYVKNYYIISTLFFIPLSVKSKVMKNRVLSTGSPQTSDFIEFINPYSFNLWVIVFLDSDDIRYEINGIEPVR